MCKLYFMVVFLMSLIAATVQAERMIYFNLERGLTPNVQEADLKFGMSLTSAKKVIAPHHPKISVTKDEVTAGFDLDSGDFVLLRFINAKLVGIMLTCSELSIKGYLEGIKMMFGRLPDRYCFLPNEIISLENVGWTGGRLKALVVRITQDNGKVAGMVEFRSDRYSFDFDQAACRKGESR